MFVFLPFLVSRGTDQLRSRSFWRKFDLDLALSLGLFSDFYAILRECVGTCAVTCVKNAVFGKLLPVFLLLYLVFLAVFVETEMAKNGPSVVFTVFLGLLGVDFCENCGFLRKHGEWCRYNRVFKPLFSHIHSIFSNTRPILRKTPSNSHIYIFVSHLQPLFLQF